MMTDVNVHLLLMSGKINASLDLYDIFFLFLCSFTSTFLLSPADDDIWNRSHETVLAHFLNLAFKPLLFLFHLPEDVQSFHSRQPLYVLRSSTTSKRNKMCNKSARTNFSVILWNCTHSYSTDLCSCPVHKSTVISTEK